MFFEPGAPPFDHVANINPVNGLDATGSLITGHPYQTWQGALNAIQAAAVAGGKATIRPSPGYYAEDATFTTNVPFYLQIQGAGKAYNTMLRSLTLTPGAAGAAVVAVGISDVALGALTPAPQTISCFRILAAALAGSLFVTLKDMYFPISTSVVGGISAIEVTGAGGTGTISIALAGNIQTNPLSGATPCKAVSMSTGRLFGGSNLDLESSDDIVCAMTGNSTLTLANGECNVTGAGVGVVDAITHTGTGSIALANVTIRARSTGKPINHSNILGTAALAQLYIASGTGNITVAGTLLLGNDVVNATGAQYPITAPALLFKTKSAPKAQRTFATAGGTTAITVADDTILFTGGGAVTATGTLPGASSVLKGTRFTIVKANAGAAVQTIARTGADTINGVGASFTFGAGATGARTVESDGVSAWWIVASF